MRGIQPLNYCSTPPIVQLLCVSHDLDSCLVLNDRPGESPWLKRRRVAHAQSRVGGLFTGLECVILVTAYPDGKFTIGTKAAAINAGAIVTATLRWRERANRCRCR